MQQWSPDGVRQERTGWRDAAISARHRLWGFNCPAVDLDFVMAEYNHGKPAALIEYKERRAAPEKLDHPTYQALRALADGYVDAPLPFLIARYDSEDWWFVVRPANEAARQFCKNGDPISEQQFVRGLFVLRKRVLTAQDEARIARLNNLVPTDPPVFLGQPGVGGAAQGHVIEERKE